MKLSILTPTIRKAGLNIVETALKRQTFKDFEWLIGSPFNPETELGHWVLDDFEDGVWTLNRIYNKLIKTSNSDVIISLQDYTFIKPDTLERFYTHYQLGNNQIISAIGDKYDEVYPRLGTIIWQDPRRTGKGFREVTFNNIEGNCCMVPKQALLDVGGFDESLDHQGYGMDWYGVLDRINILGGYSFHLDESLESYSLQHGRVADWEDKNLIHGGYEIRRQEYLKNPRLKYLD